MVKRWNAMSGRDQLLHGARFALAVMVLILATLQLFGTMDDGIDYAMPLLAVNLLIVSAQEWKEQRGQAILSICVALFIFIVSIVVWVNK